MAGCAQLVGYWWHGYGGECGVLPGLEPFLAARGGGGQALLAVQEVGDLLGVLAGGGVELDFEELPGTWGALTGVEAHVAAGPAPGVGPLRSVVASGGQECGGGGRAVGVSAVRPLEGVTDDVARFGQDCVHVPLRGRAICPSHPDDSGARGGHGDHPRGGQGAGA